MNKAKAFGLGEKVLCLVGAMALGVGVVGCQGNGSTQAVSPKDSLMLDTVISGGADSLSVDINLKIALRYPTDETLQAIVMQAVGGGIEAPSPQEYVEQSVKDYSALVAQATEDWRKYVEEDPTTGTPPQYDASKSVDFVYEDEGILSLQIEDYSYSGGAHGMTNIAFYTIDKESRVRVTEDQLFATGYQEELGRIIRARLMKEYNASDEDEMDKQGFFDFAKVAPNGNLLLRNGELVYLYNQYEIAPYAMGPIEVAIPFEEVKGLLSKESILHRYIK